MNITIVGTGNAACANAYKLAQLGHHVSLLKTSHGINDENFNVIAAKGGIGAIDHTCELKNGFQRLKTISRSPKEALHDADIVIIQVQSLYQESVAQLIANDISTCTKMIMIIPGAMGSLYFRKYIHRNDIIYAEGESTPYDARIKSPGVVEILFANVRNALGFMPTSRIEEGFNLAHTLNPNYTSTRENIVVSMLHNPNLIIHTIGVIMSASRIEYSKGNFWMYKEAFTPSIWNMINQLDMEKCRIIEATGGNAIPYLDAALWRNSNDLTIDPMASFLNYANNSPKGPSTVNTRYLTEDVPSGLVLMESIGQMLDVDVTIASALITIAEVMLQQNFRERGRTLSKLGVNSRSDLESILH